MIEPDNGLIAPGQAVYELLSEYNGLAYYYATIGSTYEDLPEVIREQVGNLALALVELAKQVFL